MTQDRHVLGVYFGHNASVALARNGKVVFALSEERVRRIKNYTGFPSQAYELLLETCLDGDPARIDLVVFPTDSNVEYHFFLRNGRFPGGRYFDYYHKTEKNAIPDFIANDDRDYFAQYIRQDLERIKQLNGDTDLTREAFQMYRDILRIDPERFAFISHHEAHAYSACFNLPTDDERLVFTLDASGDNVCATVNRFHGGGLTRLSTNLRYPSLGTFYREVTAFLGMRPDEHEFKVMGLAPYAKSYDVERVRRKFEPIAWLNEALEFESAFPTEFTRYFLLRECVYDRFDSVAGAAQAFLEDRVTEWITKWVRKTGVHKIAVAGGVFMNVKLNQRVCECPDVEDIFVVPSAADESTVIGCCYYGAVRLGGAACTIPVRDLYLGTAYSNDEIERTLHKLGCFDEWDIRKIPDIELTIAKMLANGEVVGRLAGRAEWGARALGNRSLLADPRNRDTVRVINEMIKGRDFWMPFTPSILAADIDRYVLNPKGVFPPYMTLTFNSTPLAREHLVAAIHPYDFTIRPQSVLEEWNPRYHQLLSHFKALTGIGGILNTSLNLHGLPNVQSPQDAVEVLKNSGLKHLALEDWLVSKRE